MPIPPAAAFGVPAVAQERSVLESKVLDAQITLVFQRSRAANLVSLAVVALLVWMLAGWHDATVLAAWVLARLAVSAARAWIDHRQSRAQPGDRPVWLRWMQFALMIDGALFGLIGTALLPVESVPAAAAMLATVVGVASVGFMVLCAHARTVLCFVLPLLVPCIVMALRRGSDVDLYAAVAMVIYLGLIVVEARRSAGYTSEMLRLRFQMDDLADQREQALALAVRHSTAKSQFLATMSHEMRTPLHAILGLARLLSTSGRHVPGSEDARHLDMMVGAGQHLLALINDVLDVARLEHAHLQLDNADFDLAALIREVAELSRVATADKGLRFTSELLLPQPCRVRGDASRLRQILLNLTGNAVKFTAQGGVTVRARRLPEGPICIEVIDTGVGISAAELPRIFEAFHQADASFGRRFGGTGLGLTISRELARAMGGNLVCESAPQRGSRFTLTLPLLAALEPHASNDAAAAPPPSVVPTPQPLRGARVLLVEDNQVNALVAEAMLARAGAQVETVTDGGQAVERSSHGGLDLVLMDCQMPVIDGFEATRRIRADEAAQGRARVPIVALTANALEGDRERSLAAGMDDHLAKPFSEAAFVAMLLRHLPGARPLAA